MRPLTSRRRGDDYLIFFLDSFVFLLEGLQSQTAGSLRQRPPILSRAAGQSPRAFDLLCYYLSSPRRTQMKEKLPVREKTKTGVNRDSVSESRLEPASAAMP